MRIYKCKECGESEHLRQYVWINPNDYMTCTKYNFVYEESIQKTPEIYCDFCKKWLDKFDGNSEITLLSEIANNNICVSGMIDSILAYHVGELEIAEDFYKRMWRSQ
jgi:hypothetical protein